MAERKMFTQHPERRMTEMKVRAIADSAWLRVAVYVINFIVVSIIVPIAFGAASKMIERLEGIERTLGKMEQSIATTDVKLLRAEQEIAMLREKVDKVAERALIMETQLVAMRERLFTR
jgi:hypothetical protein